MIAMDELGSSLPDPNKQTFPVLSPHPAAFQTGVIYEAVPPSGEDTGGGGENVAASAVPGSSAIELPQIYDQSNGYGEEAPHVTKDALKPTLPSVRILCGNLRQFASPIIPTCPCVNLYHFSVQRFLLFIHFHNVVPLGESCSSLLLSHAICCL